MGQLNWNFYVSDFQNLDYTVLDLRYERGNGICKYLAKVRIFREEEIKFQMG